MHVKPTVTQGTEGMCIDEESNSKLKPFVGTSAYLKSTQKGMQLQPPFKDATN